MTHAFSLAQRAPVSQPLSSTDTVTRSGAQAIREATAEAMRKDPRVFVMGEGACDPKGIFGTTLGLSREFSPGRVMEMPLSENGWTGIAIGAAMAGQRPVIVHQRVEFSLLSLEQLFNQAAKAHYVSHGRHRVPLVVRLVVGRGWGQGPMHGQSLESIFCAVPGLKVVMPSSPQDAQALLLAAIHDDNPVVFIEHRWIHHVKGECLRVPQPSSLDGPRKLRAGQDATVVATSYMTLEAIQACDVLASQGCEVDLFDLRVLSPLKIDEIVASVRRTGRLVTVDTGHRSFGIGAEIGARVCEQALHELKAPPARIGLPDHPLPSSRSLAAAFYPRSEQIAACVAQRCGLSTARVDAVSSQLQRLRQDHPLDVPHPSFKGPF